MLKLRAAAIDVQLLVPDRVHAKTRSCQKYKRDPLSPYVFVLHSTSNNNFVSTPASSKPNKEPNFTATNNKTTTKAMSFFKSSKNQTSSAASTPAQTPRSSMQGSRSSDSKTKSTMTREQAIEMAIEKSCGGRVFQGNIRL